MAMGLLTESKQGIFIETSNVVDGLRKGIQFFAGIVIQQDVMEDAVHTN